MAIEQEITATASARASADETSGLAGRFPRTRRKAPPKMFRDYGGGMTSDADSVVGEARNKILEGEKLSREKADAEGVVAGGHYAQDLHRERGEDLPERISSEDMARSADQHTTRLWIKENFEAIEADASARLAEHENALSERLEVLETDLDRWGADLVVSDASRQMIGAAADREAPKPYEMKDQQVLFEAWRSELEYDDLRYFIHYTTREKARMLERRESISRFRKLLPDRIREVKEEVEATFDAAVERGYRAKREELLHAGLVGSVGSGSSGWRKALRWLIYGLAVLGAMALLGLAGVLIRAEVAKVTVPTLTGLNVAIASAKARNAGLGVSVVGAAPDDAALRVCAQAPLPGSESRKVELIAGKACAAAEGKVGSGVRQK